jgi:hypothetical protein
MRLNEFFTRIAPLFDGNATWQETAVALYGSPPGPDGERLEHYENACRWRRGQTLRHVFERTYNVATTSQSPKQWANMATDYFRTDPWRSLNALPNAANFPAFLKENAAKYELATWVAELADAEWWLGHVNDAPDSPDDPATGPIRLAPTLEIRPYRFDLTGWLRDYTQEQFSVDRAPPDARDCVVMFWRNLELRPCFEVPSGLYLRCLSAIHQAKPIDEQFASDVGCTAAEVAAVVQRLSRKGVLWGTLGAPAFGG